MYVRTNVYLPMCMLWIILQSSLQFVLRFTPEEKAKRHPCAYMPFGYGPRNCIGMRFALLEAKMALIEIVSKFRMVLSHDTKVRRDTSLDIGSNSKTIYYNSHSYVQYVYTYIFIL